MTAYLPGDFFAIRSPGVVGWAIRVITQSHWNHVGLVVDTDGRTLEAQRNGADWHHIPGGALVFRAPLTDQQRAQIPVVAGNLRGRRYSYLGVAALGLKQLRLNAPWLNGIVERVNDLFCSQLVDYAWDLVGFHAFTDKRTPRDVTPGDLVLLAEQSGWHIEEAT